MDLQCDVVCERGQQGDRRCGDGDTKDLFTTVLKYSNLTLVRVDVKTQRVAQLQRAVDDGRVRRKYLGDSSTVLGEASRTFVVPEEGGREKVK